MQEDKIKKMKGFGKEEEQEEGFSRQRICDEIYVSFYIYLKI